MIGSFCSILEKWISYVLVFGGFIIVSSHTTLSSKRSHYQVLLYVYDTSLPIQSITPPGYRWRSLEKVKLLSCLSLHFELHSICNKSPVRLEVGIERANLSFLPTIRNIKGNLMSNPEHPWPSSCHALEIYSAVRSVSSGINTSRSPHIPMISGINCPVLWSESTPTMWFHRIVISTIDMNRPSARNCPTSSILQSSWSAGAELEF